MAKTDQYIAFEKQVTAQNYAPLPVVLTKGEGVYVWDVEERCYTDMMSAYSAVSHGHCHPRLLRVLQEQASQLCITSRAFYSDTLAPFLDKLCQVSKMDMALPMNTGAEAVETAIKAARLWGYKHKNIEHGKAEIIVASNNFHGRTTTIVSFSSQEEYKHDFAPLSTGFVSIEFGDAKALEEAITENTCAFLVEPMQGEGGIIIPPAGWLKEVQQICQRHNVLLILDEVQTGLGRTGKMFAFEHEIDAPDGLVVGKALGGGVYPVSAFLGKKEVMELFTPGSHGSTFGGNPLAAAIGLEALKIIEEEGLAFLSRQQGNYLMDKLNAIDSPMIKEVRGKGLWIGVVIDKQLANAHDICLAMMQKGVLAKETHGNVIRFAPPLTITPEQLDSVLFVFKEVLSEIQGGRSDQEVSI